MNLITPLLHLNDSVWTVLHFLILNILPSRLPIFPCLAGLVWFGTLTSLLLTWVLHGKPQYPGQTYPIAFISDIASFELKPLFLVGSTVTAICFVVTVMGVHVLRYEPGFALLTDRHGWHRHYRQRRDNEDTEHATSTTTPSSDDANPSNPSSNENPSNTSDEHTNTDGNVHPDVDPEQDDTNTTKTLRLISLLSILAAATASTALILLSVMDTFHYHHVHHVFLQICFSGLALQAAGTAVVYANEVVGFVSFCWNRGRWVHDWGRRSITVRIFASLSTALIVVEIFLCMIFVAITAPDRVQKYPYRKAAILEWIIAYLGTVYLWLFGGFFLDRTNSAHYLPKPIRREMHGPDSERTPLLGNNNEAQTHAAEV